MKYLTILALGIVTCMPSHAADILELGSAKSESYILYQGEIKHGDLQKITSAYNNVEFKNNTTLLLHSNGGDVAEAMRIGEYLDKHDISTSVWIGKPFGRMNCFSSCVLILSGGHYKSPLGRIGIHRPYITDMQIDPKTSKESLATVKAEISKYLESMGILPQLAEDMFSTPPEEIKILSKDEIQKYRLDRINYNKQEEWDISYAKKIGLSREELMLRRAQIRKECFTTDDDLLRECFRAIMLKPASVED